MNLRVWVRIPPSSPMEAKMNPELLAKICNQTINFIQEEQRLEMRKWLFHNGRNQGYVYDVRKVAEEGLACGTTMCLAGTLTYFGAKAGVLSDYSGFIENAAEDMLGFNGARMFYIENWDSDLLDLSEQDGAVVMLARMVRSELGVELNVPPHLQPFVE